MTRITTDQNQIRVQMEEAMSHADRCEASHHAAIEADQLQCDLEEAAETLVIDAVSSGDAEAVSRWLGNIGMAELLCDIASCYQEARTHHAMGGAPWDTIKALHQLMCDAAEKELQE